MMIQQKSCHPGITPIICRPFGSIIHVIWGGWMNFGNHPLHQDEACQGVVRNYIELKHVLNKFKKIDNFLQQYVFRELLIAYGALPVSYSCH